MKISLVIPNWNGGEKLRLNLPKVLKVRGVSEVLVSDDGSTDKSVEILENEFPTVKLVKRQNQGGFSTNVNNCFKNATGDLIFLLNSDAAPEEDCVEKVLAHFEDPKVFSVGFNTGGTWSWGEFKDGFFWHYQAKSTPTEVHETLWASGGSAIFKKSVWEELGGLDELMNPFYEEDVDIGYRSRKRGYINLWDPSAKVEHYKQKGVIEENFSKGFVSRVAQRNQLIFIWKNITDLDLILRHKWALLKMLIIHPKYWLVFWGALIKFPRIARKRTIEIKEFKLKDKDILNRFSQEG